MVLYGLDLGSKLRDEKLLVFRRSLRPEITREKRDRRDTSDLQHEARG